MILLVATCKEALHRLEFVRPVQQILEQAGNECVVKHYSEIESVEEYSHIIITGTSLQDNAFVQDLENFAWLQTTKQPVLGICAGMQLIGLVFGGELHQKTEIGYYTEKMHSFLGIEGDLEVYHLHNNYVDFKKLDFDIHSDSEIAQAVQKENIYGVLFHPEVRHKEMILEFVK